MGIVSILEFIFNVPSSYMARSWYSAYFFPDLKMRESQQMICKWITNTLHSLWFNSNRRNKLAIVAAFKEIATNQAITEKIKMINNIQINSPKTLDMKTFC